MAKVKISFNKYHDMWEVYYHRNGKQHVGYYYGRLKASLIAKAAQKVVDVT